MNLCYLIFLLYEAESTIILSFEWGTKGMYILHLEEALECCPEISPTHSSLVWACTSHKSGPLTSGRIGIQLKLVRAQPFISQGRQLAAHVHLSRGAWDHGAPRHPALWVLVKVHKQRQLWIAEHTEIPHPQLLVLPTCQRFAGRQIGKVSSCPCHGSGIGLYTLDYKVSLHRVSLWHLKPHHEDQCWAGCHMFKLKHDKRQSQSFFFL